MYKNRNIGKVNKFQRNDNNNNNNTIKSRSRKNI